MNVSERINGKSPSCMMSVVFIGCFIVSVAVIVSRVAVACWCVVRIVSGVAAAC